MSWPADDDLSPRAVQLGAPLRQQAHGLLGVSFDVSLGTQDAARRGLRIRGGLGENENTLALAAPDSAERVVWIQPEPRIACRAANGGEFTHMFMVPRAEQA
jgi:hypothetical protein